MISLATSARTSAVGAWFTNPSIAATSNASLSSTHTVRSAAMIGGIWNPNCTTLTIACMDAVTPKRCTRRTSARADAPKSSSCVQFTPSRRHGTQAPKIWSSGSGS